MDFSGKPEIAALLDERLPRFLAAGVDHNDLMAAAREAVDIAGWADACERLAARHAGLAEAALAAGRARTAGEAFVRAALAMHVGQSVFFGDPERKHAMQERQAALYARAAVLTDPPAAPLEIPFEGARLAGWLRLPQGPRVGCVVLTPGADSTKEEFHSLEAVFLSRGLATVSVDGPGQGLARRTRALRADHEVVVGAILDRLEAEPALAGAPFGLWGRSLGGHAVIRGATDPRVRATVSIGGFFDLSDVWKRMPPSTREAIAFAMSVPQNEAGDRVSAFTLAEVAGRVAGRVLVVHSGGDRVCPVGDARRIAEAAGPRAELTVFEEGNHVCDNIPYRARPLMADWLAEALREAGPRLTPSR